MKGRTSFGILPSFFFVVLLGISFLGCMTMGMTPYQKIQYKLFGTWENEKIQLQIISFQNIVISVIGDRIDSTWNLSLIEDNLNYKVLLTDAYDKEFLCEVISDKELIIKSLLGDNQDVIFKKVSNTCTALMTIIKEDEYQVGFSSQTGLSIATIDEKPIYYSTSILAGSHIITFKKEGKYKSNGRNVSVADITATMNFPVPVKNLTYVFNGIILADTLVGGGQLGIPTDASRAVTEEEWSLFMMGRGILIIPYCFDSTSFSTLMTGKGVDIDYKLVQVIPIELVYN
jgi:hypothetical protein